MLATRDSLSSYLVVFLLPFLILADGCKTTNKSESKSDFKAEVEQSNDIHIQSEESRIDTSSDFGREFQRYFEDYFSTKNFTIESQETEYDTSQPVNPDTGKPPVKNERETKITSEETTERHSYAELYSMYEHQQTIIDTLKMEVRDLSKAHASFNIKELLKKEFSLNGQILTPIIVGFAIIFIFLLIRRIS